MVGPDRRVGMRIPLAPPMVLAGMLPPPDVMRRLPTDAALFIAMTAHGHAGPGYKFGKMLARQRKALEEIWAASKTHSNR